MELAPMFVFSIVLPLLPLVDGGCSYSQEGKDTSTVFKDMDAARCCLVLMYMLIDAILNSE